MSQSARQILFVDDDPVEAVLLERTLEEIREITCELTHVADPAGCISALGSEEFDFAIIDYELGSCTGLDLVTDLRESGASLPLIVLTGHGDEYAAAKLTDAGADGYLRKCDMTSETLLATIRESCTRANRRQREDAERKRQAETARKLAKINLELAEASRIDPLTELLNRRAWAEAAQQEHERSKRFRNCYAVLMLDVDHFKSLNDTYGHQVGDDCLQQIAACLKASCRSIDSVGRYGGEEFVVLSPDTDRQGARLLGERIRKAVWDINFANRKSATADRVTISIGLSTYESQMDWQETVSEADNALYAAKTAGRNRVRDYMQEPTVINGDSRLFLSIDDDIGDAELLKRHLEDLHEIDLSFEHRPDVDDALRFIQSRNPSLIFVDYQLGATNGLEVIKGIRSSGYLGPIVALTGQGDEYIAAELTRSGADDYVTKADLTPDVLRRSIANARSQHRKREFEAQNRRLLEELSDLTQQLEKKNRRLAELYQTAHQFVDNVSHEFRTPLTVIKEFTSIIAEGLAGDVTEEQSEYLGIVLNRVEDLTRMVNDMLDISKLEAGLLGVHRADCAVGDIVTRVTETLHRKAHVEHANLMVEPMSDLPLVHCDQEKIGRVLINLVVNAMKFSDDDGTVTLSACHDDENGTVRFEVVDNGPGISAENLQLIFERFKQVGSQARASTKGFGLGLNIAKELVHLNLGEIQVESRPGWGSRFSFDIPVAEPARIVDRYLSWLARSQTGFADVSIVSVVSPPDWGEEMRESLDMFLHQQLRAHDMLLGNSATGWVLLLAANANELQGALVRFQKRFADWIVASGRKIFSNTDMSSRGTFEMATQRTAVAGLVTHLLASPQPITA